MQAAADRSPSPSSSTGATADRLDLRYRPTASAFILRAVTAGDVDQVALFGPRGTGKTQAAAGVMIAHAQKHAAAGGRLPTKWLGAADTFESHRRKTHESLLDPMWRGAWELSDGGHVAVFRLRGGPALVKLHLFGIEDSAALDRVRAQSHGLWFEEPAPAGVLSLGLTERAWAIGVSSCRLPTYHNPKILTLNYPHVEHWTWRGFVADPLPGTAAFRAPRDETYATAGQQAEWARALAGQKDLLRRLIEGRPGIPILGELVVAGFNEDEHVRSVRPARGEPVYIGTDGGESHTWCSVVLQRVGPHVDVLGALVSSPSGARQHYASTLVPWLGEHTPWVLDDPRLALVIYDPACDTEDPGDVDSNPLATMQTLLPARYLPGPVSWAGRLNPLFALLDDGDGLGGRRLRIDPYGGKGLIEALAGGWYLSVGQDGRIRKDTPAKPNHPHEDYGDALCYAVAGAAPQAPERPSRKPGWKAKPPRADFNPFTVLDPPRPGRRP